jgi:hypothetical protein
MPKNSWTFRRIHLFPTVHLTWYGLFLKKKSYLLYTSVTSRSRIGPFLLHARDRHRKYAAYDGVSKSFRIESITKYTPTRDTRWEAKQRVMAAKLTKLTHKIAIQLHLLAESCTICSSRSRQPVRKLSDTPSYIQASWRNRRQGPRNQTEEENLDARNACMRLAVRSAHTSTVMSVYNCLKLQHHVCIWLLPIRPLSLTPAGETCDITKR